ncbi:MAG: hypothetical protein B7Z55_14475 [Planctomycetales bacterium 12-60-4]|nr:MAG: hypothetical protein B7Z55_14475 [Planctomycetales bacterium 12-60-4]
MCSRSNEPLANLSDPDLIKVTEIFLVPSSFLVAALGTADTNPHRAAVSLIGLIVSVMWWVCSREALSEHAASGAAPAAHPRRTAMLSWLAIVFVVGWLASLIAHLILWTRPPGG